MKRMLLIGVTSILFIILGGLAFVYFSPGYHLYFVRSESMVPVINLGDMVVISPIGGPLSPEVKPGTIITYEASKGEVTHRIISIDSTGKLTTKGDNSKAPDTAPVALSQVVGVYLFKVPYIGYVTSFARTKLGWFLTIIIPTMVLVAFLVKDIIKEAFNGSDGADWETGREKSNRKGRAYR